MSLLNQMLRDLEKRRASNAERSALPNQVRALPRSESARLPWPWILVVILAVMIVGAAWQLRQVLLRDQPKVAVAPTTDAITPAPRLALDLTTPPVVIPKKAAPPSADITPAAVKPERVKPSVVASRVAVAPMEGGTKSIMLGDAPKPPSSDQLDKQVHEMTPPQLAENEYRHAIELLNQGHLPEAQSGFEAALKLDPTHAAARHDLFGLLLTEKKTDEAEHVLQEGLDLNPSLPGFALALARLQADRGDTDGAIATMQKSEAAAQNSPDYLATLAALLQRAARHAEAVEHYQAALKLAPQSGVWWMGLGISLQALDRKAEARDAFTHAQSSSALTPELQAFVEQRLQQLR